jgi:hypothetical protein
MTGWGIQPLISCVMGSPARDSDWASKPKRSNRGMSFFQPEFGDRRKYVCFHYRSEIDALSFSFLA